MPITLTDDLDTVDISEAEINKRRTPRIAVLTPAQERRSDIVQGFGSEGFGLDVEGVWVTASQSGTQARDGESFRRTLTRWRKNNVLVKYTDGNLESWFTIRSFSSRLVPGAPGGVTAIFYSIELAEAIPIAATPEDSQITIGTP